MQFLMRDSGQPDWKCGEVAGQFELKGDYLNGPLSKLSGGWQTLVKLAALLLHEPNLLLLDEPTNFLDLRTQILLEHFLREFRAACLIVSHDRAFLGATCTHTLDLNRGKLTSYPGKIDAYLSFQEEKIAHDERSNAAIMAKRRHLEDFIARNKARASTASRAKSREKQLERLEVEAFDEAPMHLELQLLDRCRVRGPVNDVRTADGALHRRRCHGRGIRSRPVHDPAAVDSAAGQKPRDRRQPRRACHDPRRCLRGAHRSTVTHCRGDESTHGRLTPPPGG